MKARVIQSNYIPWRGYFDFINQVDIFVLFDDVQYIKRSFRNRNTIKDNNKINFITAPIKKYNLFVNINALQICNSTGWRKHHFNQLVHAYSKAPFFRELINDFCDILNSHNDSLSELNASLLNWICGLLSIKTPIIASERLNATGLKTHRLVDILEKLGADTYLSGPSAACYLDHDLLREANIGLEFKTYDYDPYPQLSMPFMGNVSILDLLFNVGPDAKNHITSKTPNRIVLTTQQGHKNITKSQPTILPLQTGAGLSR